MQKTAYEMCISDWSSDVCSSDLRMFLAINSIARYEISSSDRIFAMKPLLYSGTKNASSWAMRAWLALREAGVVFEEEVVDIRRPQRFANLDRIGAFSPPAKIGRAHV